MKGNNDKTLPIQNNPIRDAILAGNLELTKELLNAGDIGNNKKLLSNEIYWIINNAILNTNNNAQGWIDLVKLCIETGTNLGSKPSGQKQNAIDLVLSSNILALKNTVLNTLNNNGETELHFAVKKGAMNAIKTFMTNGANQNIKNKDGLTPFHLACISKNQNLVELLSKYSPNIDLGDLQLIFQKGGGEMLKLFFGTALKPHLDKKDESGDTGLHRAVKSGNLELVKTLMFFEADQNILNNQNFTPLYLTCVLACNARGNNNIQAVQALENIASTLCEDSKVNFNLFSSISFSNQNALSWSAEAKNPALIKKVLETKIIDINAQDPTGKTLLFWMVEYAAKDNSWNEMVNCILNAGGNQNIPNKEGMTPFYLACTSKNKEIVESFNHCSHKPNINLENIEVLIKAGGGEMLAMTLNTKDNSGAANLHAAANNPKLIKELMKFVPYGLDLNILNNGGATPLMIATACKNKEVVELFMNAGADQNLMSPVTIGQNVFKMTPLNLICFLTMNARNNGNSEDEKALKSIGEFLCTHKNQPDFKLINFGGQSALSWIAELHNPELLIKVLEKSGVSINFQDNAGKTVLHWMVEYAIKDQSWNDMVKCLVEKGSNVELENLQSETALALAVNNSNQDLTKILLYSSDNNKEAPFENIFENLNINTDNNDIDLGGNTDNLYGDEN